MKKYYTNTNAVPFETESCFSLEEYKCSVISEARKYLIARENV